MELTTNKPNVEAFLERKAAGCYFIVVGTTDNTVLTDNLPVQITISL